MAITDSLGEVKDYLGQVKRKYRFRQANLTREKAVELQTTLAQCRGKLEICKKDLNRSINTQSRNICEGMKIGADTIIQEQIMWDAAIGYMLVRDAIYALETINSYDSVSHAYEMLDAAMKQIAGKKSGFPGNMKAGNTKERNAYGYITSGAALKTKEEQLEGFFEELKLHGNIEARLANARVPGDRNAELRHSYTLSNDTNHASASEIDDYMSRLNGLDSAEVAPVDFEAGLDSMLDIQPPKDSM